MERTAPTIQAVKTTETKRPSRAISAGLRKIPVPIMVPTTIAAEAQGPRPRTSSRRFSAMGGGESECSVWGGRSMSGCHAFCGNDTADESAYHERGAGTDEDVPGKGDRREAIDSQDGSEAGEHAGQRASRVSAGIERAE